MRKIVAITGKAGSGKDTLADMFVSDGFVKISMADPLKWVCGKIFGFDEESLWGSSEKRTPLVRKALQLGGTEFARSVDPDVWVKLCARRIDAIFDGEPDEFGRCVTSGHVTGVVIPDVRFLNEVNFIRGMGGSVVRIKRGNGILYGTEQSKHVSETSLDALSSDKIDFEVDNTGTLQDLFEIYQDISRKV